MNFFHILNSKKAVNFIAGGISAGLIVSFLGFYVLPVFANNPLYTAGQTLDPQCLPTDPDCTVLVPAGSSQWTSSSTDIYFTGGRVGIGTSSPSGVLSVIGTTTVNGVLFVKNIPISSPVTGSLFVGQNSGYGVTTGSTYSNFFGYQAGYNATTSANSNFIGSFAGYRATGANYSNFIGSQAGQDATSSSFSNFIGYNAGNGATTANGSNFFGTYAGQGALNAYSSNFFGGNAGAGGINAYYSNFFGNWAGYNAPNAKWSNFLGLNAGNAATNAFDSNFFGFNAGQGATNAANSIFIGLQSGYLDSVDNTSGYLGNPYGGKSSILIGNYTSTGGYSDSIAIGQGTKNSAINQLNLGGVLYATGISSTTTPSSIPTGGKIGIGTTTPIYTLDVLGDINYSGTLRHNGSPVSLGGGGLVTSDGNGTFMLGNSDINIDQNSLYFGNGAGQGNSTGVNNNFLGYTAGFTNISGTDNNFFGDESGYNNIDGSDNVFMGYRSGYSNTSGNGNVFFGNQTGKSNTDGFDNYFIGSGAGESNNHGWNNFFVGYNAGNSNTTGTENIFLGLRAGQNSLSGSNNIMLGDNVGTTTTSGSGNILIGSVLARSASDSNFLNIGNTLYGDLSTKKIGIDVASPAQTLDMKAGGTYGYNGQILAQAITTLDNYFFGNSGNLTMTGSGNTAVGDSAFGGNTTGIYNTAIGENALYFNTTGTYNVAIGQGALFFNIGGLSNVAIGHNAGSTYGPMTTNASTFIGDGAASSVDGVGNSTAIGSGAVVTKSNQVVLGDSSVTETLLNGNIFFSTSTTLQAADEGSISVLAGGSASGPTGNILIRAGGTASSATGGNTTITTGGSTGISGALSLSSAGTMNNSGKVSLFTGSGFNITGDVDIYTGNVSYISGPPGTPGNIKIHTGSNSGGTFGNIILNETGGKVAIGTTSPTEVLTVTGSARFTGVGSGAMANDLRITADGTLTTNTSDRRLKNNILILGTSTLDKVLQLNPVSFSWKGDTLGARDIGFIAQEVQPIFPETVFQNSTDGYFGINYSRFPAILTKAIQELNAKVDAIASSTPTGASIGIQSNSLLSTVTDWVGSKITATFGYFENLTVGTSEKPTGITLYDEISKQPYCLKIANGVTVTSMGECGQNIPTQIVPPPAIAPGDGSTTEATSTATTTNIVPPLSLPPPPSENVPTSTSDTSTDLSTTTTP